MFKILAQAAAVAALIGAGAFTSLGAGAGAPGSTTTFTDSDNGTSVTFKVSRCRKGRRTGSEQRVVTVVGGTINGKKIVGHEFFGGKPTGSNNSSAVVECKFPAVPRLLFIIFKLECDDGTIVFSGVTTNFNEGQQDKAPVDWTMFRYTSLDGPEAGQEIELSEPSEDISDKAGNGHNDTDK